MITTLVPNIATVPVYDAMAREQPQRLAALMRFLDAEYPQDPPVALHFSQRLANRRALITAALDKVRKSGEAHDGERDRLSQQEWDYILLAIIARTAYVSLAKSPFENDDRRSPLPISPEDHHHAADLHPEESWRINPERIAAINRTWPDLLTNFAAGLQLGPLSQRNTAVAEVFELIGQRAFPGVWEKDQSWRVAEEPPPHRTVRRAMQAGYAVAIAEGTLYGHMTATALYRLSARSIAAECGWMGGRPRAPQTALIDYALGLEGDLGALVLGRPGQQEAWQVQYCAAVTQMAADNTPDPLLTTANQLRAGRYFPMPGWAAAGLTGLPPALAAPALLIPALREAASWGYWIAIAEDRLVIQQASVVGAS